jgi:hypothetical protein
VIEATRQRQAMEAAAHARVLLVVPLLQLRSPSVWYASARRSQSNPAAANNARVNARARTHRGCVRCTAIDAHITRTRTHRHEGMLRRLPASAQLYRWLTPAAPAQQRLSQGGGGHPERARGWRGGRGCVRREGGGEGGGGGKKPALTAVHPTHNNSLLFTQHGQRLQRFKTLHTRGRRHSLQPRVS